jgi:large subunit ribosomal protein L30
MPTPSTPTAAKAKAKKIKVTLLTSPAGHKPQHRATLDALKLRRPNHSRILDDTPQIRGMLAQVGFMLQVEDVK